MKAYSQDLRERVIAAVDAGQQSQAAIAKTFGISESTLDKWVKRWRDTGSVAALPFGGGRQRALKDCAALIRAEVKQQPDVTLEELCERVGAQVEVTASRSMMSRELRVLALPRKKRGFTTANGKPRASSGCGPPLRCASRKNWRTSCIVSSSSMKAACIWA